MRKTTNVARVKEHVNNALANAEHQDETMGLDAARAYRQGVAAVLETVLHETGNYKGFAFTDSSAERTGDGYLIDGTYDETRRAYY